MPMQKLRALLPWILEKHIILNHCELTDFVRVTWFVIMTYHLN